MFKNARALIIVNNKHVLRSRCCEYFEVWNYILIISLKPLVLLTYNFPSFFMNEEKKVDFKNC